MSGFDERLRLQFDLLALAYQTNTTRDRDVHDVRRGQQSVVRARRRAGRVSPRFRITPRARASMEKLAIVQNYHSKVFSGFLAKLAATPDGDRGSILDNSIFLYGSNMSNSNNHDSFPLPTLVFGNAGGKIKGNQHVRYADHTPIGNLLYTLPPACRRTGRQGRRQHGRARGALSMALRVSLIGIRAPLAAAGALAICFRGLAGARRVAARRGAPRRPHRGGRRPRARRGREGESSGRDDGAALGRLSRRRGSRRAADQGPAPT